MTDQPGAVAEAATPVADTSELSIDDARKMLEASTFDDDGNPVESADDATAEPKLPEKGNTAPEKVTGETQEQDPAEEPLIPLPRSWAKEQAEHWEALPRATQEYLIAQDSKASAAVRQAQNEAAEKLKGLTVKEQQAEEARAKYEAKLPEVMQGLVDVNNRDYADIKSQADIDTLIRVMNQLAPTDPVQAQQINAYLTGWQLHQAKMAATKAELDQTNQRKAQKEQAEWAEFISTNNAKAAERIPELADPDKSQALTSKAGDLLRTIGFTQDELDGFQRGSKISPYDHRMQDLIFKAIQAQDIQQAKAAIPAKLAKLPQVQRPGVARPAGAQDAENIKVLEQRLNQSGSEKDAWALYEAQMKAASRRAS